MDAAVPDDGESSRRDHAPAFEEKREDEVASLMEISRKLCLVEDPDEEPFRSKYRAREALKKARQSLLDGLLREDSGGGGAGVSRASVAGKLWFWLVSHPTCCVCVCVCLLSLSCWNKDAPRTRSHYSCACQYVPTAAVCLTHGISSVFIQPAVLSLCLCVFVCVWSLESTCCHKQYIPVGTHSSLVSSFSKISPIHTLQPLHYTNLSCRQLKFWLRLLRVCIHLYMYNRAPVVHLRRYESTGCCILHM